jgi:hypothetical protein
VIHNDFPLAHDSCKIDLYDLSKYSKECFKLSNQNPSPSSEEQ